MATELSRTFDTSQAKVVVEVKDAIFGNVSVHTIYLGGASGVTDPNARIQEILTDADTQAAALQQRMIDLGWTPNGN